MIKNPPIIKRVARSMGGKIQEVLPKRGCFYIHLRGKKFFVERKFSISKDLTTTHRVTRFKDLTYKFLKEFKVPTPKTLCIYRETFNLKGFKNELSAFKYPLIIKDAEGSNSKGIFPFIKNYKIALQTITKELNNYSRLVVQEMAFGKEYRVLVLGNKVIAALELIPPRIFGNGKDSIKKLIAVKQKRTKKQTPLDKTLRELLEEQGFNLKSIPAKGRFIFIKRNSSLAEGGETKDVTEEVHKEISRICVRAAECTGRYLAGIDIICEDISRYPKKYSLNIIEINGKPDIYIHYNPTHGKSRNVVKMILERVIEDNL